MPLPPHLLPLVLLTLTPITLSHASPQPALVSSSNIHLMPHNTLFLRQSSDLQTFSGAIGGFRAPSITNSGDAKRPFAVNGDTFTDFASAGNRACDGQFNECSRAANEAGGNKGAFSVGECDVQKNECRNAQQNARVKDFAQGVESRTFPDPQFPEFLLVCDR